MKNFIKALCCFVLFAILASCGSSKPPVVTESKINTTITQTLRDTIFKIEKDSSFYNALLECQDGKVVIKQVVSAESGRSLKSPKVRLENNQLIVDCEARAQELLAQYKDTHEITVQTNTVIQKVNELTFWQKQQIYLFRITAGIGLLLGLWLYIKSKF